VYVGLVTNILIFSVGDNTNRDQNANNFMLSVVINRILKGAVNSGNMLRVRSTAEKGQPLNQNFGKVIKYKEFMNKCKNLNNP